MGFLKPCLRPASTKSAASLMRTERDRDAIGHGQPAAHMSLIEAPSTKIVSCKGDCYIHPT